MKRLADLFSIRPGEGRMATLLIGVMLFTSAGSAVGGTGIEALFFSRFGVQYLPYMYMVLGTVSFLTSLAITAMLGRLPKEALYVSMPLVLAVVLVGERLVTSFSWAYPVMWLGKEVMNSLIGLFSWGLAGALCDTRQAKRLFPIFNAGRIFGAVIGGLGTGLIVARFGTENLLLVWAASMFIAFVLGRALLGRGQAQSPVRKQRRRGPSLIKEMQQGYQFVRRSPLMQWVSVAAILFSVLFFSLALPFSKAATTRFADVDQLAGFLGLFNGLSTAAAFLTSLFLANRLFTRFGIMSMILAFPVIYLIGFGMLAAYDVFAVLVIFRFIQMLWLSGVADSAYQAMFNAVPAERRDQVRAFIGGVPEQAGTFIAGLVLVIGEQALQSQQLYLIGLIAAVATTFVIWRAGRAYSGALVAALKAGQPQLFFQGDAFSSFRRDATAVSVAVDNIANPDPAIRRVAAEILGNLSVPSATDALVIALNDSDAQVRAASLKALACAKASPALLDVATRLKDPEPEVRLQAIESLGQLSGYKQGVAAHVSPLLEDADSAVRARAAVALLRVGPNSEARDMLRTMAALGETDERVHALTALGDWGDSEACELIATELGDTYAPPAVRWAAASALVCCDHAEVIGPLVDALSADDRSVREAVASALGQIGLPALDSTVAALFKPEAERGALLALENLPAHRASETIRKYVRERIASALHYHALWSEFESYGEDYYVCLLVESLRDKAQRHGLNTLRALSLLGDRDSLSVVIGNLKSRDPNQRANALETLESVREAQLIRPLLKLWEVAEAKVPLADGQLSTKLLEVLNEQDSWMRACAALAAAKAPGLLATVTGLARSDPDPVVRDAAGRAASLLNESQTMDTLPTLSLMERILFFRRVPLFAGLSPADLKQVAGLASEHYFPDSETIAYYGEPGEEMFIIVSGEVRVMMTKEGGTEYEVARRKLGECVGEMAIINQEPRMASLVAAGDLRVLCIDRKQFEGLLRERPETGLAVMRVLCARLKEATNR